MSIVMFIILGAIVGYIASRIMGRDESLFASIAIGIVGSFIGSIISEIFTSGRSYLSLSWSGFIWSLIGSIILAGIMNSVFGQHHHHTV